ncbi:MAG: hypothetical protein HZA90_21865 [Verrucomicrobia bacterium]|nr:hypothetical protein [Verrucomicrobiota bacterium]
MNALGPSTQVHLGPGTFQTLGYSDELSGGWQVQAGMKIVGAGIDVTTLQVANRQSGGTPARSFAIGHALAVGSPLHANLVDFCEASDLTIDCNFSGQSGGANACGAVRLMGNHVRIARVKAKNWGSMTQSKPCFVLAVVTGDRTAELAEVFDAGIEGCIVVEPAVFSYNTYPSFALYAGAAESTATNAEAYGKAPFIRNCFVDCGGPSEGHDCRALSMGWCRGGIVEGNQVHNTKYGGPFLDKASIRDVIVRNNYYRNVVKGPFWDLGVLNPTTAMTLSSLVRDTTYDATGKTALATTVGSASHDLQVGERVKVTASDLTPPAFKGVFVVSDVPATNQFRYRMVSDPGSNAATPAMQKVLGVDQALIELNTIELASDVSDPVAIHLCDHNAGQGPDYAHGGVIIRQNKIRYVNGDAGDGWDGTALQIEGAKNALISDNLIECGPTDNPIKNFRCGTATYFNNKTPSGALIRGRDGVSNTKSSELETEAEDALLLTLI